MKTHNRLLAALLVMALLFGIAPLSVLAEDTLTEPYTETTTVTTEATEASSETSETTTETTEPSSETSETTTETTEPSSETSETTTETTEPSSETSETTAETTAPTTEPTTQDSANGVNPEDDPEKDEEGEEGTGEPAPIAVTGNDTTIPEPAEDETAGTPTVALTIKTSGVEEVDEDQVFLFRVTGQGLDLTVSVKGNGSTIISGLQSGKTYTVTELTDWSWRYKPNEKSQNVAMTVSGAEASFEHTRTEKQWLDGNSSKDIFKNTQEGA